MPPEDEKVEEKTGLDALLTKEEESLPHLPEDTIVEDKPVIEEETKPAESETKPPVEETKPAETETKEEKRETRPTWKQLKEQERQRKAVEAENAELKRRLDEIERAKEKEADDNPPADFEDPLDKIREEFKGDLEETKKQVEQTSRQLQEKAIFDEIVRQENDFQKDHEDYKAALDYLVESARTEWTYDGSINRMAKDILKNNRAELEQWAIDNHDPNVPRTTFIDEDTGEVKLGDAAKEAAFRVMVNARRRAMVDNWRGEGRNIAQAAYEFAHARGFSARAPAKEEPKKNDIPASRERVVRAKESEAASASLSSMQDRGQHRPSEITKRSQVLDMDDKEREAYIDKMDKESPGWFEELE